VYSSRGIAWHSKHKHVFHNTPSGANVSWALDFLFKIASGRVALTDASDQGTKGMQPAHTAPFHLRWDSQDTFNVLSRRRRLAKTC
jgi:hypothetical protein